MKTFFRIKQKLYKLKEKICVAIAPARERSKEEKREDLEAFKIDGVENIEIPLTRYEHKIEYTGDDIRLYMKNINNKLTKEDIDMIKYFKHELNYNISSGRTSAIGWRMIGSIKDCFKDNDKIRYYNYINEEDRRDTIQAKWNKRKLERSLNKKDTVEKKHKI